MPHLNSNLQRAKQNKNDEFYTCYQDIAKEVVHYKEHLKGKHIYMNCDNPNLSCFYAYFLKNFKELQLERITASCYREGYQSRVSSYDGVRVNKYKLKGNGDFRSDECIELLKQADIVITNPPFSLAREYIAQLFEYDRKFLIIASYNAVTYKDVFPLFKDNRIWLGVNSVNKFIAPDGKEKQFGNIVWFTNLFNNHARKPLRLTRRYSPELYPKYDNYDAINVDRVKDIPFDYMGVMGVPITYFKYHNADAFTVLGSQRWEKSDELMSVYTGKVSPPESDMKTLIRGREKHTIESLLSVRLEVVGTTECCGKGLSNGLWEEGSRHHALIDDKRKYKRIFIRRRK